MDNTRNRTLIPSRTQDGFTLIEVLISLVVILFSFMAALTVLTSSYRSGSNAETQTMAIFLAESKLEELRHKIPDDLSTEDYFDRHGGGTTVPADRFFKRTLTLKRETPSQFSHEVKVEVQWPGGSPVVYTSIIPAETS
jgi:prepilin-type N-terminal cleavage/methylation domain-containing protein